MGKATPYPYKKTVIYGDNIGVYRDFSDNVPFWFYIVNFSAVAFCLLTCFIWLICAMCTIGKNKPCNHKVHEAHLIVEEKEEDGKKSKTSKKGTNSQRSSRKEGNTKKSSSTEPEQERNEGGKCSIEMKV